jgi:hypothetical protein
MSFRESANGDVILACCLPGSAVLRTVELVSSRVVDSVVCAERDAPHDPVGLGTAELAVWPSGVGG